MTTTKLKLTDILRRIDIGDTAWWESLEPDERKQISFWLLNRYISSVKGNLEDTAMAVLATNEYYNKNWNVLGAKHPQLQWQLLCSINEDQKVKFHKYINLKRKTDSNSKVVKLLMKIYPNKKVDEVQLIARISSKKEIREFAKSHGLEDKDIDI